MATIAPEHWFLASAQTARRPHFTTGNQARAHIDGKDYMADLLGTIRACAGQLLIAGWRVTGEQILDPVAGEGGIRGSRFADVVAEAARRGCAVKALMFNVPGTELPGPFRIWHAKDNAEFAKTVIAAGGEAQLDSRLPPVPASSHHQKFILAMSRDDARHVGYVGGIDICLDRWDTPSHNSARERQTDRVQFAQTETHTASQPGWHDVQVRVEGPAVDQIWQAFRARWNDDRPANHDPLLRSFSARTPIDAEPAPSPATGTLAIQVNQTLAAGMFPARGGPGESTIARALERAIARAEHYVYVEDQYVWPCSLVEQLEAALKRGVRVLMVVARDYDAPGLSFIAKRLRLQVMERLRKAGGDRFRMMHIERNDGKQIYVHAKVLLVDDCYASIGSANFNARSLTNDSELQLGIVDTALVTVPFGGKPQQVTRFAHELRCALWAEHLECTPDLVRDPIAAFDGLWARAPIAPSRRAHPHDLRPSPLAIDPVAEYVTTLITAGIAKVPIVPLPPQVNERAVVKLAVDAVLRGPHSALLLKFLEEMLNPDIAPLVATLPHPSTSLLPSRLDRRARAPAGPAQQIQASEQILNRLRRGQLPRMVDWFDPALLVRIGIRDIISGTIGQYADQRLMQAASDQANSEQELASRYDFSNPSNADPRKRVAVDGEGAVWVDYVADLGDGFEATFAIAHLLAQEKLTVANADEPGTTGPLPAGEILVMGGDQCYPQGTQAEYERRLVEPYTWAYATDNPRRKLFAIPGNHDWYDGLGAFSSLFTSARDRISGGVGRQIGGWLCYQHRSYFAIKLPHDWWIWGPDIQLEGNLDDPQRDYFDIVSERTKPGDKIVICLAEPSWHHQNYDNLHEISMLARKHGAKVCAVLAGDWHHYSRYTNSKLGVHFITSGGGGAFAHATHQLKPRLELKWVELAAAEHRHADSKDPPGFNAMEAHIARPAEPVDFTLGNVEISARPADAPTAAEPAARSPRARFIPARVTSYGCHAPRIYPSSLKSRLLGLKNLLLPFRNLRFLWLVGCIYFIYAWVFEVSAPKLDTSALQIPRGSTTATGDQAKIALSAVSQFFWASISPTRVVAAIRNGPFFFFMLLGLWAGLVYYVELGKGFINGLLKFVIGTAHFLAHLTALLIVSLAALIPTLVAAGLLGTLATVGGVNEASSFGRSMLELANLASYALLSILIGGFVGASIMGLYWTLTSLLMNMHCGNAFSALMIRDYKHFLRMRFEADQLTIYPIAIDKVPGRHGWRVPTTQETLVSPSLLAPKKPLEPRLIEPPIAIKAADVQA